ncbi:MAG: sigma-70 family RNA polymerase sigma factor [Candidatus Latescibacteria bacterium]|nr:sigma-70 family RNA polymerase sigma factor [Candidatus Latescibacterota bacterium]
MENSAISQPLDIVERCKQGDRHSYKELYDLCKNRVYSTAIRLLGNAQDAEDAVQETFIKVFKNIHMFRGDSSVFTWIYRISVNICIEHMRKKKNVPYHDSLDDTEGDPVVVADTQNPVTARLIIEKEIEQLPEGFKTVFVLHTIEGFKHREIADILDISEGTSKSQLAAAKSRLREQLLPYLEVIQNEL